MNDNAIDIIHSEHRSLAAVLHCLDHVTQDIRQGLAKPDFALFEAIVDYVADFPDVFHHPKEEEYLFKVLLDRAPELRDVIEQQRAEHDRCDEATAELRMALKAYERGEEDGDDRFFAAVEEFLEFERKHMSREERHILPKAREVFTAEDHARLNGAFAENADPMFGSEPRDRFRKLFSKIVAIAPQPYGFGPRQSAH